VAEPVAPWLESRAGRAGVHRGLDLHLADANPDAYYSFDADAYADADTNPDTNPDADPDAYANPAD
jgi:hypothetical protein